MAHDRPSRPDSSTRLRFPSSGPARVRFLEELRHAQVCDALRVATDKVTLQVACGRLPGNYSAVAVFQQALAEVGEELELRHTAVRAEAEALVFDAAGVGA